MEPISDVREISLVITPGPDDRHLAANLSTITAADFHARLRIPLSIKCVQLSVGRIHDLDRRTLGPLRLAGIFAYGVGAPRRSVQISPALKTLIGPRSTWPRILLESAGPITNEDFAW